LCSARRMRGSAFRRAITAPPDAKLSAQIGYLRDSDSLNV
jgi:hypothetical protein